MTQYNSRDILKSETEKIVKILAPTGYSSYKPVSEGYLVCLPSVSVHQARLINNSRIRLKLIGHFDHLWGLADNIEGLNNGFTASCKIVSYERKDGSTSYGLDGILKGSELLEAYCRSFLWELVFATKLGRLNARYVAAQELIDKMCEFYDVGTLNQLHITGKFGSYSLVAECFNRAYDILMLANTRTNKRTRNPIRTKVKGFAA